MKERNVYLFLLYFIYYDIYFILINVYEKTLNIYLIYILRIALPPSPPPKASNVRTSHKCTVTNLTTYYVPFIIVIGFSTAVQLNILYFHNGNIIFRFIFAFQYILYLE